MGQAESISRPGDGDVGEKSLPPDMFSDGGAERPHHPLSSPPAAAAASAVPIYPVEHSRPQSVMEDTSEYSWRRYVDECGIEAQKRSVTIFNNSYKTKVVKWRGLLCSGSHVSTGSGYTQCKIRMTPPEGYFNDLTIRVATPEARQLTAAWNLNDEIEFTARIESQGGKVLNHGLELLVPDSANASVSQPPITWEQYKFDCGVNAQSRAEEMFIKKWVNHDISWNNAKVTSVPSDSVISYQQQQQLKANQNDNRFLEISVKMDPVTENIVLHTPLKFFSDTLRHLQVGEVVCFSGKLKSQGGVLLAHYIGVTEIRKGAILVQPVQPPAVHHSPPVQYPAPIPPPPAPSQLPYPQPGYPQMVQPPPGYVQYAPPHYQQVPRYVPMQQPQMYMPPPLPPQYRPQQPYPNVNIGVNVPQSLQPSAPPEQFIGAGVPSVPPPPLPQQQQQLQFAHPQAPQPQPQLPLRPNAPNVVTQGSGLEDDDSKLCLVCLERDRDTVLLNCAHFGFCERCAASLKTCPVCRSPVVSRLRVFSS